MQNEQVHWLSVNFPGKQSGPWVRVKTCPLCKGVDCFAWHSNTGQFGCQKCKTTGNAFTLGYNSDERIKLDYSPVEKEVWKYHKNTGKKHRLTSKVLGNFPLKIKSVKIGKSFSDKLCFLDASGEPIKWLAVSGKKPGWFTVSGRSGIHILNQENLYKDFDTIYILAGEWDLFSFFENTGIHGITLSTGETSVKMSNFPVNKFEFLTNKNIIICYDNDTAGRQGGKSLARAIASTIKTKSIKILDWSRFSDTRAGCDIDDYFQSGGNQEKLFDEIGNLSNFENVNLKILPPDIIENRPQEQNARQIALYAANDYLNEYYNFRYNKILSCIEYQKKTDEKFIELTDRCEEKIFIQHAVDGGTISRIQFHGLINQDGASPPYDHFNDFFRTLPEFTWDMPSEIDKLIACMNVIKTDPVYFKSVFTKWLIACYKQAILDGRNEYCFILCGPQHSGKTSFGRMLCEPISGKINGKGEGLYYYEGTINADDKDSITMLGENFLINLDELENTTKKGIAGLKSLITSQTKKVRRPFARRAETIRRRASFFGSVNDSTDLLEDHTGNRRWLVFEHEPMDFAKRREIDFFRLWAEVKFLAQSGVELELTADERSRQTEENLRFMRRGLEYEFIDKIFLPANDLEKNTESADFLSASEVADAIQKNTNLKINPNNIGRAMTKHGILSEVRKVDGKPKRGYWLIKK